jgi:hypothetical protein
MLRPCVTSTKLLAVPQQWCTTQVRNKQSTSLLKSQAKLTLVRSQLADAHRLQRAGT